jgi:hypothetical protein
MRTTSNFRAFPSACECLRSVAISSDQTMTKCRPFVPLYEPPDSPFFVCILVLAFHSTFLFYFSYCSISPFAFLRFCALGYIYPCTLDTHTHTCTLHTHTHMYTTHTHTHTQNTIPTLFCTSLLLRKLASSFPFDLRTCQWAQPPNLPSHLRSLRTQPQHRAPSRTCERRGFVLFWARPAQREPLISLQ